jgi:ABC-type microcin C transport system duplicated ATPase subunit YejF
LVGAVVAGVCVCERASTREQLRLVCDPLQCEGLHPCALVCDTCVRAQVTASLDPVTEQAVMDSLLASARRGGFALLLVTHRLSSIRAADVIHVLREGTVVETGRCGGHLCAATCVYVRVSE